MAVGFATHLWIDGSPDPATIRAWVLAADPDAREGDLVAMRLGPRVLISAVNVADHTARWRSIGLVERLVSSVRSASWTFVDLHPDQNAWCLESSDGTVLEWDAEAAPAAQERPDPALVEEAKTRLRAIVPLPLTDLGHYVEWTHLLERVSDGAVAPPLTAPVARFALGLPAARPAPKPGFVAWRKPEWIVLALCLAASAFTVSVIRPAGPAAFALRATHFAIEGTAFWSLFAGASALSEGGSRVGMRTFLGGCLAIAVSAAAWGVVPL